MSVPPLHHWEIQLRLAERPKDVTEALTYPFLLAPYSHRPIVLFTKVLLVLGMSYRRRFPIAETGRATAILPHNYGTQILERTCSGSLDGAQGWQGRWFSRAKCRVQHGSR